jgi:hypothetical protein
MASITGTITGNGQTVTLTTIEKSLIVLFTGTYTDVEIEFEGSADGATWVSVALNSLSKRSYVTTTGLVSNENEGYSTDDIPNLITQFRIRSVQYSSGTVNVSIVSSLSAIPVEVDVSGASTDAAGRLRTAEPITIFDHFFTQDSGTLFWDTSLTGSATVSKDSNANLMNLTCTTASGDKAVHQTRPYFPHQAGKAHQVLMTGILGALKTNVRQRVGYFDDDNGIFFEQDGTNLRVVRRTDTSGSPVDNAVNQSSWNLDKLDGTGDSGITLDTSLLQLFVIDFEWLGAGRLRMGFSISGEIVYCHEFATANTLSLPFMNTPTLPIRYEIENTGTAASSTTLKQICCTVVSEGGWNPLGIVRSANSGSSEININSTDIPVVSIRLKSANNRAIVIPTGISVGTANGRDILWKLFHGASLTGASWTDISSTAFTQFDNSASSLSGGEVVASGFATADQSLVTFDIKSSLWLNSDISGTSETLTLAVTRIGGGTAKVVGAITYKEFL